MRIHLSFLRLLKMYRHNTSDKDCGTSFSDTLLVECELMESFKRTKYIKLYNVPIL